MSFTVLTGNLLTLDLPAIGHGCNCVGLMGAGLAAQVRATYPDMYLHYRQLCVNREFKLGEYWAWHDPDDGVWVYNLATQRWPGPHATLSAVGESVRRALEHAHLNGVRRLGVPRLGCGLGGLEWTDVYPILKSAGNGSPLELIAVTPGARATPRP